MINGLTGSGHEQSAISGWMMLLMAIGSSLVSTPSRADTLLIQRIQKEQSIDMPARGSRMDQVRHVYGEPDSIKGPVGNPPITTWIYPRFSCYFEKQWVIDCVAHKVSPLEKGPKPLE